MQISDYSETAKARIDGPEPRISAVFLQIRPPLVQPVLQARGRFIPAIRQA
jgi:hypothetical protein